MVHLINTNPDTPDANGTHVDANNFAEQVIEKSRTIPVLVDFWAPWCGPCKNLTPILETLAEKYSDAFRLVKINIDEQQELAMQFQVRSVPTVYLIKDATVIDAFMGALPESAVKEFLSKHIELNDQQSPIQPADPIQKLIDDGREAEAIATLTEENTDESRLRLARLFLHRNDLEKARMTLEQIDTQANLPEYRELVASLHFYEWANSSVPETELQQRILQNENDWDAYYRLAATKVKNGNHGEALDLLLQIVKRNRKFNDDAGRKGMVMVFDIIGDDHVLVTEYRNQLARSLF